MSSLRLQFSVHKLNFDNKTFLLKSPVSKDEGDWVWEDSCLENSMNRGALVGYSQWDRRVGQD